MCKCGSDRREGGGGGWRWQTLVILVKAACLFVAWLQKGREPLDYRLLLKQVSPHSRTATEEEDTLQTHLVPSDLLSLSHWGGRCYLG